MDLNSVVKKKKGVVFRRILDEMVLLDTKGGEVVVLNDVGGDIWEYIDGSRSLKEILELLQERYEVEREVLERDLLEFVDQLWEAGLIEEVT